MNTHKQRLEYVDVMRGIAITLVVAGHLLQFNGVPTSNPAFEFIYSFHMPLFFAISGYITCKVTKVDSRQSLLAYCRKKTISIALPFVTWTLFIGPFVLRESWNTLSLSKVTNMLLHPGLWFLKTLYLILLIYGVFCYMWSKRQTYPILRYASWFCVTVFSLIVIMLGIEEKNFLLYFFAFYLGVLLSLDKRIYAVATSGGTYALSITLFFLLATHWNFSGGVIDDFYKIIISLSCFVLMLNYTLTFKMYERLSKMFQFFGKESLAIYVIQFYLTHIFTSTIDISWLSNSLLLFLIIFVVSIPLCYICCWISLFIKSNKYLGFIILGLQCK